MKKIDLYMLRSFVGPLILTFFIVMIVFILQFLWMYVDELAGKGLEIKVLAELLFQFSMTFVPLSLPLAILLASLMTFGNLGEFMELTAIKSSGISLQRIMMPLMVLTTVLCIGSFLFSDFVLPISTRKARTLLHDIRRKKPDVDIQAGTFFTGIDGFSIKITHKDAETGRLDGIYIYDHRNGTGNSSLITADSGYMATNADQTKLILTLFHGNAYVEMEEKGIANEKRKFPFRKDTFNKQIMVITLKGFGLDHSSDNFLRSNYTTLNTGELTLFIDSLGKRADIRSENFFNEFNRTKLYSNINYSRPGKTATVPVDTVQLRGFDPRAIYDTLKLMDQMVSVNKALTNAREGISYLTEKNETLTNEIKRLKKYEAEFYKRFTLPLACLVFFFIGAPLGAIIRKGGLGTPAVISVLFFIIYYVISLTGEKLAKELFITVPVGMFASTMILLPIGIFLTYKATTDSALLNTETYIHFFRRIGSFFSGIKPTGDDEDTGSHI